MRLSKGDVIWVLQHLIELRKGENPEQHLSYLERPLATRRYRHHANFENAALLAGEVEGRLKLCGLDGLLVKAYFAWEEPEESLARFLSMPVNSVNRGIRLALKYVSNKWPKDRGYQESKNHP